MSVLRFPPRRAAVIWITRAEAWLVLAGAHGWLCGSLEEARAEARWLARNLGLPIRERLS